MEKAALEALRISDLPARLASKLVLVERQIWIDSRWQDFECWEFTGRWRSRYGYGRVKWNGMCKQMHRVVFEVLTGEIIPPYKHGDHLCRNPPCARPLHIEPVKPRENVFRGQAVLYRHPSEYEVIYDDGARI